MDAPSPVPRATIWPPLATPARRPAEASPFPAMVPPTWVPCPDEVSEFRVSVQTPFHFAE